MEPFLPARARHTIREYGSGGRGAGRARRRFANLKSRWIIVINTNRNYVGHDDYRDIIVDQLRRLTVNLLETEQVFYQNIVEAFRFGPPGSHTVTDERIHPAGPAQLYERGELSYAFEIGGRNGALHEHIDLVMVHQNGEGAHALRMNVANLREYFQEGFVRGVNPQLPDKQKFPRYVDTQRAALFISVRQVRADMMDEYMDKDIYISEEDKRRYNAETLMEKHCDVQMNEKAKEEVDGGIVVSTPQ